jgi:ribosomal protein L27
MGRDHTLFALSHGRVRFDKGNRRIHIDPSSPAAAS